MEARYGLLNPFDVFEHPMHGLFEDFLGHDTNGNSGASRFPPVNVWEDSDAFYAETELPGVRLEDIEVTVHGNHVSIKGERKPPADEKAAFRRQERPAGPFARVLHLPVDLNPEKVEAALKDGVLTLKLPKAEAAKPRRIPLIAGK